MKILVAIEATNPKIIVDKSLRWCGRVGFEMRVFFKNAKQRPKYEEAIADANYHYYLALEPRQLIARTDAMKYARAYDFDLVITIPQELSAWRKGTQFKANEIKYAYETIAKARGEFSRKPSMRIKRFANGAVMRRVTV